MRGISAFCYGPPIYLILNFSSINFAVRIENFSHPIEMGFDYAILNKKCTKRLFIYKRVLQRRKGLYG